MLHQPCFAFDIPRLLNAVSDAVVFTITRLLQAVDVTLRHP
jgi:hypothetical protein